MSVPPSPSNAYVYYDPDRYGDKELKIAAVNKIRQNVRDAVVNKPYLAEAIIRISVADSLTFEESTGNGGGEGCVLDWVKGNDCDSMYKEGAETLTMITGKLRKTTEVTRGDVVALAGEEALESVGGERCRVQIGRLVPAKKVRRREGSAMSETNRLRLYMVCLIVHFLVAPLIVLSQCGAFDFKPLLPSRGKEMGKGALEAFLRSGLTAREAAIVAGVCGDIGLIVGKVQKEEEEEYVNEMGEIDFIPGTSFGGPKEIYGKTVGDRKVGGTYLKNLKVRAGGLERSDSNTTYSKITNNLFHAPHRSSRSPRLGVAYGKTTKSGVGG